MAPPPPATLPLVERLKALAQTLQFAWFIGHLTLLLSVFRYSFSVIAFNWYSTAARISYRLAFVSAILTYGIVVYKGHFARGNLGSVANTALKLVADENVQYLAMALVWLYSRQFILALLPFSVYSVFHVATYARTYIVPTVYPQPAGASPNSPGTKPAQNSLVETIGRFIKAYYDGSMEVVAYLEIALLFRLILSAITFSKGSWVLLTVYLAFFRARYAQSSFVQKAVGQFVARIDSAVSHQGTPPPARQAWEAFKGIVCQGYEATNISRFISGPTASKKPQ